MFMLFASALWLLNKESQILLINRLITSRKACKPCNLYLKSTRGHTDLIWQKENTR